MPLATSCRICTSWWSRKVTRLSRRLQSIIVFPTTSGDGTPGENRNTEYRRARARALCSRHAALSRTSVLLQEFLSLLEVLLQRREGALCILTSEILLLGSFLICRDIFLVVRDHMLGEHL